MPSTAAGAPIYVSSSSESDDQDSGALVPGRKPYSIGLQELPASLREFLAEAYASFMSSHQPERAGKRVSLTTYGKAQASVVQTLDSTIQRIKIYPVHNAIGFSSTYPLDSDLSGG